MKKDCPDEINEAEEALLNYLGKNDLKVLKRGCPDKWKYLTKKLSYPNDYYDSSDDFRKHVNNLKKEHLLSNLKYNYLLMKKFKEQWILLIGSISKMGKN